MLMRHPLTGFVLCVLLLTPHLAFAQPLDAAVLAPFVRIWRHVHSGGTWDGTGDNVPDGILDHKDAEAAAAAALCGVVSVITVRDALTLQPIQGATVTAMGRTVPTDAAGSAIAFGFRGDQIVAVAADGHDAWGGYLTLVAGHNPTLYLAPSSIAVTVLNHQEHMEAVYEIAEALTPILTEFDQTSSVPNAVRPSDDELRAAARHQCQLQAVQQLSGVADEVILQVVALPAEAVVITTTQVNTAADTKLGGMKEGADKLLDQRQRALRGEDVPEMNAYLSAHPYAGYTSLAEIREDIGRDGVAAFCSRYLWEARSQNGLDQMIGSASGVAVTSSQTQTAVTLTGKPASAAWGTVDRRVATSVPGGDFRNGVQILFGRPTKLPDPNAGVVLAATIPDGTTTVPWPEGEWSVTVSGGRTYTTASGVTIFPPGTSTLLISHPCNAMIGPDGGTYVWVPPGEFMMGADDLSPDCQPIHGVRVTKGFRLSKYETTNAQFAAFLNAYGSIYDGNGQKMIYPEDVPSCKVQQVGGVWRADSGWIDHPVTRVTWYGAKAYCDHYGLRLATEAEWEYAARGTQGRKFPWGDTLDVSKLVNWDNRGPAYDAGTGPGTLPVGSYPAGNGWCGASDMAGNVAEWCNDWWEVPYIAGVTPEEDPIGPATGIYKTRRGGSWSYMDRDDCRSDDRTGYRPTYRDSYTGFRPVMRIG